MAERKAKTTQENCPECDARIPVTEGFSKWCPACDWNVNPSAPDATDTYLAKRYEALGKRHGKHLFSELATASPEELGPRVTVSNAIALAVSTIIHLSSFGFLACGIYLAVAYWPNGFAIFFGLVCLGFFWLLRPRLATLPEPNVDRRSFPALFRLIDNIAEALNTESVDTVVINEEFNAAYGRAGTSAKPFMYIGLPLWTILKPDERVALIAHELSHGANGDPTRGRIVGTALDTLDQWYILLTSRSLLERDFFEMLIDGFLWLIAKGVEFISFTLASLLWLDHQRSEYLADYLATRASGTNGMISCLHKLNYGVYLSFVANRSFHAVSEDGKSVIRKFNQYVDALPNHEVERIMRIDQLEDTRLDDTHPPTAFRIAFLVNHPEEAPRVVLSDEASAEIDRELKPLEQKVSEDLMSVHAPIY